MGQQRLGIAVTGVEHLVLGVELLAGLVDLLDQLLGVGMLVERPGLACGGRAGRS